jgi:hypothetical protein
VIIRLDMHEVSRDAIGMVLAIGRGDVAGAQVLAASYPDPVSRAALEGALAGLAWRLAQTIGEQVGAGAAEILGRAALAMGGGDGLA